MRTTPRQRHYLARPWLLALRPALRYSATRDAFVLRGIGGSRGPVLRPDRRVHHSAAFDGADRRGVSAAL